VRRRKPKALPKSPDGASLPPPPRIPETFGGIQVNYCKAPRCPNFGVPAGAKRPRLLPGAPRGPGAYKIVGIGARNPALKCQICGEIAPMRSNRAVFEELQRMSSAIHPTRPGCPNQECAQFGVSLGNVPGGYWKFGKTSAGNPRHRCKLCGTTFTELGGKPLGRQVLSHRNRDVFMGLVNYMPLARMIEMFDIAPQTLYDKIDFVHRQCVAFAGARERVLAEGKIPAMQLDISVDRQHYVVNWSSRVTRRNVQLNAMASADRRSGYVFGFHLNFDDGLAPAEVEADALVRGDVGLMPPYRRWARVWLDDDYSRHQPNAQARNEVYKEKPLGSLTDVLDSIDRGYEDASLRDDVEATDVKDGSQQLPRHGCQVHETYVMYAHMMLLERLTRAARHVSVHMDLDSGFRAAFLAAFQARIKSGHVDGFFVRVGKEATTGAKKHAVEYAMTVLRERSARLGVGFKQALVGQMLDYIEVAAPRGRWGDKWVVHPAPNTAEPFKAICWLTPRDLPLTLKAWLHLRSTLHPVDRFFMLTRRRVQMAERPVVSARKGRTMWHGYAPYNPGNLAKILEVLRVYYNFCLATGKDKRTPAMRLGLARAPVDPQDVLYFTP